MDSSSPVQAPRVRVLAAAVGRYPSLSSRHRHQPTIAADILQEAPKLVKPSGNLDGCDLFFLVEYIYIYYSIFELL